MFTRIINKHKRHAARCTEQLCLIERFNIKPQKHGIEYTEQIAVGYDDDMFLIIGHDLIEKGLQAVPFVTSAFRIGKHSVVDCPFLLLHVIPKPLDRFSAAFSQIPFPEFLPQNGFHTKIISNDPGRMLCAKKVGGIDRIAPTSQLFCKISADTFRLQNSQLR